MSSFYSASNSLISFQLCQIYCITCSLSVFHNDYIYFLFLKFLIGSFTTLVFLCSVLFFSEIFLKLFKETYFKISLDCWLSWVLKVHFSCLLFLPLPLLVSLLVIYFLTWLVIFNFELICSRVVSHGVLCAIDFEGVSNRSVSQFVSAKTLHVSLITEEFLLNF